MTWYTLRQNNSYGKWDGPIVIGVEADSEDKAAEIASRHGVYFNGCDTGADCACCGDRWSLPFEVGQEPTVYERPVRDMTFSLSLHIGMTPYVLVHADGRVEEGAPITEADIAIGREESRVEVDEVERWRAEREQRIAREASS